MEKGGGGIVLGFQCPTNLRMRRERERGREREMEKVVLAGGRGEGNMH